MREIILVFKANNQAEIPLSEYRGIWASYGVKIVQTLEATTKMRFYRKKLVARVADGFREKADDLNLIFLPANIYPGNRGGVIVRALGKQLLRDNCVAYAPENELRVVNLFLYYTMNEVFGERYTEDHIRLERNYSATNTFDLDWNWYLNKLTREKRKIYLETLWKHSLVTRRSTQIVSTDLMSAGE